MEPELTEEEISHFCVFMRMIDLFNEHPEVLAENAEIKEKYDLLCAGVNSMFEMLTDEQRDFLLEQHKLQLEEINRREVINAKRRQKRKEVFILFR